jgi:HAE1 family hydrophobic/amphiphilic exporter-1
LQNPPTIRIGGQVTKSFYQFSLQSPDKEELYAASRMLEGKLSQLPELEDVTTNLMVESPQVRGDHRP